MANKFEKLISDAKKTKGKQSLVLFLGSLCTILFVTLGVFYLNSFKIIVNPQEAKLFKLQLVEGSGFTLGDRFVLNGSKAVLRITSIGFQNEIITITDEMENRNIVVKMLYDDVRIDIKHEALLTLPRWELDGILITEENNPSINLLPGEYILSVASRYHKSITKTIKVLPGLVKPIKFEFESKDIDLNIISQPTNALLFIDDKRAGSTPFNRAIAAGRIKIEIRKEGFRTHFEILELHEDAQNKLKKIRLQPIQRLIPVKYFPEEGNLFLDGNPIKIERSIGVPRNSNSLVRYEVPGYKSKEIQITKLTKIIDLTLEPSYANLKISSIPNSSIFIADKYFGETSRNLKLLAKKHLITLRANGYAPYRVELDLKESSSNSYIAELITLKDYRLADSRPRFTDSAGISMRRFTPTRMNIGAPRGQKGQMANEQLRTVDFDRSFYISEFEITNKQFSLYSGTTLMNNLPVKGVSWEQAVFFCNWLSKKEGLVPFYKISSSGVISFETNSLGYRLPTEAEWEYVARLANRREPSVFVWGNEYVVPAGSGNLADVSAKGLVDIYLGDYDDKYVEEAPVGIYGREISGLYDMAGNVSEWVHDFYSLEPPDSNQVYLNYMGPEYGESHVIKGSNYTSSSWTELRASFKQSSQEAINEVGFRVARYLN